MDRIANAFARARAANRAAFVAYLCAGDPDFDTSLAACRALLQNGTDILELGVPFSDPLADGLTNQLAAQRALAGGMTSARVLELVDPVVQRERLVAQAQLAARGDDEAMRLDEDFLRAMEYGMPPAGGMGTPGRVWFRAGGVVGREKNPLDGRRGRKW